ncbi:MAG TPA: hypothetical protein VMT96_00315 [Candidatus Bathyarchaeia archaeon]|nr:hypothetical protein [Candidatus Bathyarchaeia archaeon]
MPLHELYQNHKERLAKAATLIAIGGAALTSAACSNESASAHNNSGSVVASEATPSPDKMSADEFMQLSRAQQLDYAAPILNSNMANYVEQFKVQVGHTDAFSGPLVQPSVNNTPQQIWDQVVVGAYQAWKIADQGNMNEAKKVATGVAEGQAYDLIVNTFQDGGAFLNYQGATWAAQPVIQTGSYEGVDAKGYGLIEFKVRHATDTDKVSDVVFQLEKGSGNNSYRWVFEKQIDS